MALTVLIEKGADHKIFQEIGLDCVYIVVFYVFFSLNARFGTTAVPNLLFFHKSKVVRFNITVRTIESMAKFVHNLTSKHIFFYYFSHILI